MRRWLTIDCEGETLAAALDSGDADSGLLIVSGGNETLSGSHGNMAMLAARVAAAGHPVFRYERRGIGDSTGANESFEGSRDDLAAAVAAFRAACPALARVVAFGNCDGATTLALFHGDLAIDALALANPWVIEAASDLPPPAAIRARYKEKLLDPSEWMRLLRGGVNIGKLFKGLSAIAAKPVETGLAARLKQALTAATLPIHIILAKRDATALAFADAWGGTRAASVTMREIDSGSHSFAGKADADALFETLLSALRRR